MNILVVAAHPDDEVLGLGGTIRKHYDSGDVVKCCILSREVQARENKPPDNLFMEQIEKAKNIIGIDEILFFDFPNIKMNIVPTLDMVKAIEKAIEKFEPEIVYTHTGFDLNEDHRIVFNATMAAVRLPERMTTDLPVNLIKKVLCYEVPSSTEWAPPLSETFVPNYFVDISAYIDTKIEAITQYEGVIKSAPHPRSIVSLKALAQFRGCQVGFKYAEGFGLVRELQ